MQVLETPRRWEPFRDFFVLRVYLFLKGAPLLVALRLWELFRFGVVLADALALKCAQFAQLHLALVRVTLLRSRDARLLLFLLLVQRREEGARAPALLSAAASGPYLPLLRYLYTTIHELGFTSLRSSPSLLM